MILRLVIGWAGLALAYLPAAALAVPFAEGAGGTAFGQSIAAASENSWLRLNTNQFIDVWTPPDQRPAAPEAPSVNNPARVLLAWSSMAWDSQRGDLIFWGGGHANYPGNEVYRWHASTLEWERASLPSEVTYVGGPTNNQFETVDGYLNTPIASHTWDNSEYLPIIDRFVTLGGAAFNTGGPFVDSAGTSRTGPYFWDPAKGDANKVGGLDGSHVNPGQFPGIEGGEMWENRNNLHPSSPAGGHPGFTQFGFINGTTAYAQENGKDVLYIGDRNLWKYTVNDLDDPSQDTYEQVGQYWNGFSGAGAGAFDPVRNMYVRTAGNQFTYWDMDSAGAGNQNVLFTPFDSTGTFSLDAWFGMDYDPMRERFVLWDGNGDVWYLNPPSDASPNGWTIDKAATAPLPALPSVADLDLFQGVLGKWKYLPGLDVFAGVTDYITGDIWIYKPEDWSPEFQMSQASEPAIIGLFAFGLAALGWARRRTRP